MNKYFHEPPNIMQVFSTMIEPKYNITMDHIFSDFASKVNQNFVNDLTYDDLKNDNNIEHSDMISSHLNYKDQIYSQNKTAASDNRTIASNNTLFKFQPKTTSRDLINDISDSSSVIMAPQSKISGAESISTWLHTSRITRCTRF